MSVAESDLASPIVPLLEHALAVRVRGALDRERAAEWARGVHAARAEWTSNFGGLQFTLGRAWYTHLETNVAKDYFANARASDAIVERACPGMQDAMRALASRAVGAPVIARPGWAGPGVHVFPAGGHAATHGGDIHFDTEGLTPAHVRDKAPTFTIVVMLEPPRAGGGLKVWDVHFSGADDATPSELQRANAIAEYEAGDLVCIEAFRLHQIQPFEGDVDRVSATLHAAFVNGRWETWF
jgi:hypothetical protein